MFNSAKTHQRRSGEPSDLENREKRSRGEREMERRARRRRDPDGRRAVRGRGRVAAIDERAQRSVFHRDRGIRRVRRTSYILHCRVVFFFFKRILSGIILFLS